MKIVIVGNGPAAIGALRAIATFKSASNADEIKIILVSAERVAAYSPMFLVHYLSRELGEEEILLGENNGLSLERLLGEKVIGLQNSGNKVILESGREIGYDKLLIASGASPLEAAIEGIDKDGVHFFNRLADVKGLAEQIPNAKSIIIIGAGATGIEAAIAFRKMGKSVLVVEMCDQILPQMLDKELARYLEGKLSDSGVSFLFGEGVSEVTGDSRARGVVVGGKEVKGDLVVIVVGLKPNIDFLKASNVKVNRGILVDEKMRTNVANIYAAGDVAETVDPYGRYELVFNWYNAIDQGWIAGCNLIGIENIYRPSPGLMVLKGMEPPVISVGRKYGENGYETLSSSDVERDAYERIFIKDKHMDCYQAIGVSDKVGLMYNYIRERKDITGIESELFDNYSPAKLVA